MKVYYIPYTLFTRVEMLVLDSRFTEAEELIQKETSHGAMAAPSIARAIWEGEYIIDKHSIKAKILTW